jgi:hypothetical protein
MLVWYFIALRTWVSREGVRRIYINASRNQTAKVWVEKLPSSVRLAPDFTGPRDFKISATFTGRGTAHQQFGMPATLNENNIRPGWMINRMYDLWEKEHDKNFDMFDTLWAYVRDQEKLLNKWKQEKEEKF